MQIDSWGERQARQILNSKRVNHIWKKDFRFEQDTIDWDLINSEGIKIEVKSTIDPVRFRWKSVVFHSKGQEKQIVMKVLLDKNYKITAYKFIKMKNNYKIRNNVWIDITDRIIK